MTVIAMDYSNKQIGGSPQVDPIPLGQDDPEELPALPPKYAVVMLDDDKTPMRFVVELLENIFHFNRRDAVNLMMTIHTQGRGICGTFALEIAQTKAEEVVRAARRHNHPLRCITEKAENQFDSF